MVASVEALELSDIQGLVAGGYGKLPAARYLALSIDPSANAQGWLSSLASSVTPAVERPGETSIQLALTSTGLRTLGLPGESVAEFSMEFVDGMVAPHRSRLLGDLAEHSPEGWDWGGPTNDRVDGMLLLYASDETKLAALADQQRGALSMAGLRVVTELDTFEIGDFEHFGFRDGVSQPNVEGLPSGGNQGASVPAGEFVLGYRNGYGRYTHRPLIDAAADPQSILPRDREGSGRADLGANGSYLVFRQLRQDVPRFWSYLDAVTKRPDGTSNPAARTALAAKMVGRWPSGAPLVRAPVLDDPDLATENDFGYHHEDPLGMRCPLGAHIRRAAPRDSLDPRPGSEDSIAVANRHRLLRRGREYGRPISVEEALVNGARGEADGERGLHFICLNANLARQFEFVQHTWVNDRHFNGLYDDVDPIGAHMTPPGSTFTVPEYPVRKRASGIPSFISVRGGGYFFLPGIRAIRYLATL